MTRPRLAALAVVAIAVALIPGSAHATNRQYQVLKCHISAPSSAEVALETNGAYRTVDACAGPDQRFEVTVDGFGLPGQFGAIRLHAPDYTKIVGVIVDANLRRDSHHLAQLAVVEDNAVSRVLANGADTATGLQTYTFSGLNATYFVAQLICGDPGGCPNSTVAHTYVKNIDLVLEDRMDPGITSLEGNVFEPGWQRGIRELQAQAVDLGGGITSMWAAVNGAEVSRTPIPCVGGLADAVSAALVPCPVFPYSVGLGRLALDTRSSPFVNGTNQVDICVVDFAGNGPTCQSAAVKVDNEAPTLAFDSSQDPADPELIRAGATDPHSGLDASSAQISYRPVGAADWTALPTRVEGGALLARVDSVSASPGPYEFQASVNDLAGNSSLTSSRRDGEPMTLTFPLKSEVQLVARIGAGASTAQTIGYGHDSAARGRLLDAYGEALADREVAVTEYFGTGALIDRRVRTVVTNRHGHWTSALPAGPNRSVSVSFAGTLRYRPETVAPGELRVRSRASLRTSSDRIHEGHSLKFAGKVGHFGARIPSGGKLIELQVREGKARWNTVGEAFHTDSSGRFGLHYRFGRFYDSDARFVFRVKVAREQAWPYEAPGRSRARTVTVVANR